MWSMQDQLAADHSALLAASQNLITTLTDTTLITDPAGLSHEQHRMYGDRAASLARLLDSALVLTAINRYAHAFVLLRAALEHHLFDEVLMRATLYRVRYTAVSQKEWARWEADRVAGKDWTQQIEDWSYNNGNPTIVFRNPFLDVDPTQTLALFYFLGGEYDPFQGPKGQQKQFIPDFSPVAHQEKYAEQMQRIHGAYLGWDDILANLKLNRLLSERNAMRMDVHYRFLSAFVHPFTDQRRLLHGTQGAWNTFDHYSSELALLYIVILGGRELRALIHGLTRPPRAKISDPDSLRTLVRHADLISRHMWFPGQPPHDFDRVQEANNRKVIGRKLPASLATRTPPDQVRSGTIRYYRNPLRRLIRLHSSANELTGFSYTSPWHRRDAFLR